MMQKYFKFPVFLLSVLVFVSSCSSGAELDTLKPKGPTSRSIDALSDTVFLIAEIVLDYKIGFLYHWLNLFRRYCFIVDSF